MLFDLVYFFWLHIALHTNKFRQTASPASIRASPNSTSKYIECSTQN